MARSFEIFYQRVYESDTNHIGLRAVHLHRGRFFGAGEKLIPIQSHRVLGHRRGCVGFLRGLPLELLGIYFWGGALEVAVEGIGEG